MKKKIIITENQLLRLKERLNEENQHARIVKQLKDKLQNTYEPIEKYVRKGGEYSNSVMVKNKVDEEEISVADLFSYLKYDVNIGDNNDELIKQVIKDWMFGSISDDNKLSKNIPLK